MNRLLQIGLFLASASLAVADAENLLVNGDFEAFVTDNKVQRAYPESWMIFSALDESHRISMTRSVFRSERQSVRMRAQQEPQAYQGIFQSLDVEAGAPYKFTAHVCLHESDPPTPPIRGYLAIDWLDEDGNELQRDRSEQWDHTLNPQRWYRYEISARAPQESATAIFSIVQEDGRIGTGSGSFFIDDASVSKR